MCADLQDTIMIALTKNKREKARRLAQMFEDFEKNGLLQPSSAKRRGYIRVNSITGEPDTQKEA